MLNEVEYMIDQNKFPNVNYIGNKNKLASWITSNIPVEEGTVLDLFAGGSSVSYELKKKGYRVISNDSLYSSFIINKVLIENSKDFLLEHHIDNAFSYENECQSHTLRNEISWLENRLFYPCEVDELSKLVFYSFNLEPYNKYIFQSLIRRAMIRKLPYSRMNINWENIQKLRDEEYSYKKYGRRRAYHNQSFTYHMKADLHNYNNAVFDNGQRNVADQLDSLEAVKKYNNVDVIYLDPPYPGTMNNYSGFYGAFDKIFSEDIFYKDWTNKDTFLDRLKEVLDIAEFTTDFLMLSLNTKVKPDYEKIIDLLSSYGNLSIEKRKHNYQISGKENKNKNVELLITLKLTK